jgi:hypothetical protein
VVTETASHQVALRILTRSGAERRVLLLGLLQLTTRLRKNGRGTLLELVLECFALSLQLIVSLDKHGVGLLDGPVLNFDHVEDLAGEDVLGKSLLLLHRPVELFIDSWHDLLEDAFSLPGSLLHRVVLLLQLVDFALEVEILLLLHDFLFLLHVVVLRVETLCLVVDEVAQHFKRVFLFDFFPFKQLSHLGDLRPDFFPLLVFLPNLLLKLVVPIKSLFQVFMALLALHL